MTDRKYRSQETVFAVGLAAVAFAICVGIFWRNVALNPALGQFQGQMAFATFVATGATYLSGRWAYRATQGMRSFGWLLSVRAAIAVFSTVMLSSLPFVFMVVIGMFIALIGATTIFALPALASATIWAFVHARWFDRHSIDSLPRPKPTNGQRLLILVSLFYGALVIGINIYCLIKYGSLATAIFSFDDLILDDD